MLYTFEETAPKIHRSAFVHPSAELIGRVVLKKEASVWPGVVLRGDIEPIVLGVRANVQDNTAVHTSKGLPVVLGTGVTVGHAAIIHGARVGDYSLIGMGAILLDGAVIGRECLIGAGAVVPEHVRIPPCSLVLGVPGKVVRRLRADEIKMLHDRAKNYVKYAQAYVKTSKPIPPSPRQASGRGPAVRY